MVVFTVAAPSVKGLVTPTPLRRGGSGGSDAAHTGRTAADHAAGKPLVPEIVSYTHTLQSHHSAWTASAESGDGVDTIRHGAPHTLATVNVPHVKLVTVAGPGITRAVSIGNGRDSIRGSRENSSPRGQEGR